MCMYHEMAYRVISNTKTSKITRSKLSSVTDFLSDAGLILIHPLFYLRTVCQINKLLQDLHNIISIYVAHIFVTKLLYSVLYLIL